MKEIRLHGRGGQGAVLAAELMVVAAFEDGKYGQAFPAFGGERRGAPVQAFVRLDARPVRLRYRVNQPDYVIILDRTLPNMVDVLYGLKPGGLALMDSEKSPAALFWSADAPVYAVPATRIALEVFGQPFVNPAMLGAWAAATGEVSVEAIQRAYQHRFPGSLGEKNSRAAQMGYDLIRAGATPVQVKKSEQTPGGVIKWEREEVAGVPGQPLHFASVVAARTSLAYPTGGWRYNRPVVDPEACNGCGVCEMFCPDSSLTMVNKLAIVDYEFCKGCGICAQTCARHAIQMVIEEE
ncbi:MAG: 2-oxoacid:acceptor oxidoreductase family protein [Anaerolineales bacterium]|nr:2-oxoacid:acceptor oxidoreductase family protein [Anaerolineales bacterium]MDO9347802.1 2-oxoacid:acceptor oxidoreductase family protein [Anaerolineales bacterium]MDP3184109.1 2-oxoacid:acceptor oxidoreductase family protein [Anaerolineales bacterium]